MVAFTLRRLKTRPIQPVEFDFLAPYGDGETAATVRLRPVLAEGGHLNCVERVEVLSVDYAWRMLPNEIGRIECSRHVSRAVREEFERRINANQQLLCEIDAIHRSLLQRRGSLEVSR